MKSTKTLSPEYSDGSGSKLSIRWMARMADWSSAGVPLDFSICIFAGVPSRRISNEVRTSAFLISGGSLGLTQWAETVLAIFCTYKAFGFSESFVACPEASLVPVRTWSGTRLCAHETASSSIERAASLYKVRNIGLIFDNQTRTPPKLCCRSIQVVTGQKCQCAAMRAPLTGRARECRWTARRARWTATRLSGYRTADRRASLARWD